LLDYYKYNNNKNEMNRIILFIDTSDSKKIVLGLDGERKTIGVAQKDKSLLDNIVIFLKEKGCTLDCIKQIKINPGPGSFTGLRVGFSVANLLGWYFSVPVNSLMISQQQVALPKYE
jgi:tRNA A37 threonylcarbamoyladenosine modification protein TsaB